ncbi:3455_t:CDS:2, partial [Entrophospora sp. SA101]
DIDDDNNNDEIVIGPNKKRKHLERVEETRYNLRSRGPRKNYKDGPSNVHQKGKGVIM